MEFLACDMTFFQSFNLELHFFLELGQLFVDPAPFQFIENNTKSTFILMTKSI